MQQRRANLHPARFALVELLFVIGIVAVLMGLLLSGIAKARVQAGRVACMSTVRPSV